MKGKISYPNLAVPVQPWPLTFSLFSTSDLEDLEKKEIQGTQPTSTMSALSLSISSIATKLNPNHQVLYIGCMTKVVANCVYLASKTKCRNEIPYRKMIQNVALEVNFERWHFHKEAHWTMNRSFTATSSKIEGRISASLSSSPINHCFTRKNYI